MTTQRKLIGITLLCLGLIASCDDGGGLPAPGRSFADGTGAARVPLSTWSNTGKRYRLAASFDITGPESQTLSTSGDEPELLIDLVIGDYEIELLSGWQLFEVDADGAATLVTNVVRTSENPQAFTITNQEVTPVVFSFAVGDDIIAFGEGRGTIETDVVEEDRPVEVVAGYYHTCALLESGSVRCWGRAAYGQLGYGNTTQIGDTEPPRDAGDVSVGGRVVSLDLGFYHTCAVLDDGAVRCWGINNYGQLGYGDPATIGDNEAPSDAGDVPVGAPAVAIATGAYHSCALLEYGAVRCWGHNSYGQLGYGDTSQTGEYTPASDRGDVPLGEPAIGVSAGYYHTCALLESGNVRCWGYNYYGQLGYGHTEHIGNDETPELVGNVELGAPAIQVSAGGYHTCALTESNTVRCWGRGSYGQTGYAQTASIGDDELPVSFGDVSFGEPVISVDAGRYHSCALLESGSVTCWGRGVYGPLGRGDTASIGDNEHPSSIDPLPVGTSAVSVSAGMYHSCITTESDVLRCWGYNTYGQLGLPDIYPNHLGDNEPVLTAGPVEYR